VNPQIIKKKHCSLGKNIFNEGKIWNTFFLGPRIVHGCPPLAPLVDSLLTNALVQGRYSLYTISLQSGKGLARVCSMVEGLLTE
jgi:hypothetical protein